MEVPGPGTVLGDFTDAELAAPDLKARFRQQDGRYLIRTAGVDGQVAEFPVAWTFGVEPLQQYLLSGPGGRLQAFAGAWDSRPAADGGQRWFDLYPDQVLQPGDPLHWTGIDQTWNYQCAECHVTGFRKGYDPASRVYASTWSEEDVSCESCHGPGSRHVQWARSGGAGDDPDRALGLAGVARGAWRWEESVGKPVRSSADPPVSDVETCGRCHARRGTLTENVLPDQHLLASHRPALLTEGLYHPDGQILDEVFEYGSFLQSRMAAAGVACSDCHEPHSLQLRAPGNAVCSQCHAPTRYDGPVHTRHAPEGPGSQCVDCHMPERTYMVVDPRRDHSLRIPRPDLSVKLGVPNACNACHTGQSAAWAAGEVTRWLGARDTEPHFGEVFAAARGGDPAAAPALQALVADPGQPAIVRGTALLELARFPGPALAAALAAGAADDEPLVRLAAAQALDAVPPDLRPRFGTALLGDDLLGVRVEAARHLAGVSPELLSAADRAVLQRALTDYEATLRQDADRPEAQLNLGNLRTAQGAMDQAAAAYREAIALDPGFAPAYANLADSLRRQGGDAAAVATLRAGLERAPDDPGLRHSLGLALVRQGDREAALLELRRAAESAPDSARYAYVLGVALHDAGQAGEALTVLEAARRRHPTDGDILEALAAFSREAGRPGDAAEYERGLGAP